MKPMPMAALLAILVATPVAAKWAIVDGARTPVAGSGLSVTGATGWNRWSRKPAKKAELWSFDGPLLNRLTFYGGIAGGETLARETNHKRNPLPAFAASMHASDVAELIERTRRITENAPDFTIEAVEPAPFAGKPGFRVRYRYTTGELVRRGEARGGIVGGRLYMIDYTAPALHYFDAGLPQALAVVRSAQIG